MKSNEHHAFVQEWIGEGMVLLNGIYLVAAILVWSASGLSNKKTQGIRIFHDADNNQMV
jgi:hypothetical protein